MSEYRKIKIPFTKGKKIGSGAFGEVFLAEESGCKDGKGREFALKIINCSGNEQFTDGFDEVKSLVKLQHSNIVKMFDFGLRQERPNEAIFSLLLEYCANGNLNDRLRGSSSRSTNIRWMCEIASAVSFLHRNEIIHQDLKPDNVLLTANNHIKVADFGLAKRFSNRGENQTQYQYYIEKGVGAICYVAPEMLDNHHTYKVDIFAMGILFHAILERSFMDYDANRCYGVFVDSGKSGKEPLGFQMYQKKRGITVPFRGRRRKLIEKTLKYKREDRPTAEDVEQIVRSRWRRWRQLNVV